MTTTDFLALLAFSLFECVALEFDDAMESADYDAMDACSAAMSAIEETSHYQHAMWS